MSHPASISPRNDAILRALCAILFFGGGVLVALVLRRIPEDFFRAACAGLIVLMGVIVAGGRAAGFGMRTTRTVFLLAAFMAAALAVSSYAASIYHASYAVPADRFGVGPLRRQLSIAILGQQLIAAASAYTFLALLIGLRVSPGDDPS